MTKHVFGSAGRVGLLALVLSLVACAAPRTFSGRADQALRNGTVVIVQPIEVESEHQLGLGAEVGTSAGSLIANQAGGGTRRDLVTVLAAIGGGSSEDETPDSYRPARDGQRVVVRLDNGVGIAITQEAEPELQVGERVRVEGRGPQARVLRRPGGES